MCYTIFSLTCWLYYFLLFSVLFSIVDERKLNSNLIVNISLGIKLFQIWEYQFLCLPSLMSSWRSKTCLTASKSSFITCNLIWVTISFHRLQDRFALKLPSLISRFSCSIFNFFSLSFASTFDSFCDFCDFFDGFFFFLPDWKKFLISSLFFQYFFKRKFKKQIFTYFWRHFEVLLKKFFWSNYYKQVIKNDRLVIW